MRKCPWCEGKGVTGKLVHGEDAHSLPLLGRSIPVVHLVDQPCGFCKGAGQVSEEKYREATGRRPRSSGAGPG